MHQSGATALPSFEHNAHHELYSCMRLGADVKHFHVEMHGFTSFEIVPIYPALWICVTYVGLRCVVMLHVLINHVILLYINVFRSTSLSLVGSFVSVNHGLKCGFNLR